MTAICRRCLLEESGQADMLRVIRERIALIDADERTPPELYRARLEVCARCASLASGTCLHCGCYVELRAAHRFARCPHPGRTLWR